MRNLSPLRLFLLVMSPAFSSCGSDVAGGPEATPTYSVQLQPSLVTLSGSGDTALVRAVVTRHLGSDSLVDGTVAVVWRTSDPAIAIVEAIGQRATVRAVAPGGATVTAAVGTVGATSVVTVLASPCTLGGGSPALLPDIPVQATLSTDACQYLNRPSAVYRMAITTRQGVRVDLTDHRFTAWLLLVRPDGSARGVAAADSVHVTELLEPGTYFVVVSPDTSNAAGSYRLLMTPNTCTLASATQISLPWTIDGSLSSTDCRADIGTHPLAKYFRFTLPVARTLQASLRSDVAGTFAVYDSIRYSLSGYVWDRAAGSDHIVWPLAAGVHYAWVRADAPGATGPFTLALSTASGPCNAQTAIPMLTPDSIPVSVNGALGEADCLAGPPASTYPPNTIVPVTYSDAYRLTLSAAGAVRLVLSASFYQPYLLLVDSTFSPVAHGANPATIETSLASGTYYVVVTSTAVGVRGTYQLTAARPSAPASEHGVALSAPTPEPQAFGQRPVAHRRVPKSATWTRK